MKRIITALLFVLVISSCNSYSQSDKPEVSAKLVECETPQPISDNNLYEVVTSKLIKQLGGYEALSNYQFYLSDSFTLTRYDNEKNSTDEGGISEVQGEYKVFFNWKTPGVFKSYSPSTNKLDIYFGEKEDEFLRFNCSMDGTCYLERIYQKRGQCLYKGKYWRIDSVSDIELMIKIEKSSLKKEEVAKGRLLK